MANDVFLTRRQLLLAKIETTYGTDSAPSHAASHDAIRLVAPFTLDLGENWIETTGGNLSRGAGRPIPTTKPSGVKFRTYVQGIDTTSFSATVKPPIAELLRACGLFETFSNSNGNSSLPHYEYAPSNDVGSDSSITIVPHQDGKEHRLLGCRGNVNFIWSADAPVIAEFDFRGQLSTEAETTRAAPVGFPNATPPQWIDSGSIIVNSFTPNVENLNFGTNNKVFEEPASAAKSASGIVAVLITERAPGGSFDPEAMFTNSSDFFQSWRASSGAYLKLNAGLTQGNQFTIISSQMIYKKVAWGDKQGLSLFNVNYEVYERSADDQYLIMFQ